MPKSIQLELIVGSMAILFGVGVGLFLRHDLRKSRRKR